MISDSTIIYAENAIPTSLERKGKTMRAKNQAKLLKEKRIEADLTQAEVANALGWSTPQFVSNIERGLAGIPAGSVKKLCRMFNKRLDRQVSYIEFFEAHMADEARLWGIPAKCKITYHKSSN